jgi:hypothetical protein
MSKASVLLIGANGALGRPILQELQRKMSLFSRIGVLTAPDRVSNFAGMDLEVQSSSLFDAATYAGIVKSLNPASNSLLTGFCSGFTVVISAVGNDLMILQPAMVDAAVKGGVRHFYASEWNSDIAQPEIHNMRYMRDKQSVRSYLRRKAASTPGFQYTLMITGIFTEWAVDAFYGFDHANCTANIFGVDGNGRVGVTSIPDIARYTVASILKPFEGTERTLRVQGWSGPLTKLVQALETARGCSYRVNYTDAEVARHKEEACRTRGDDVGEMMFSIKPLLASGFGIADGVGPLDNHRFDFEPEQPETVFRRVFA